MFPLNKSMMTNLIGLTLIVIGYTCPYFSEYIKNIGFYATSGSLTNWLAIYMLFEKIPFLYGSGVIPGRFEEFKLGIKNLVMSEFFTEDNLQRFFNSVAQSDNHDKPNQTDLSGLIAVIPYDNLFEKLVMAIKESPLGGMLAMVGGDSALEPIRPSFKQKMSEALEEIVKSPQFQNKIKEAFGSNTLNDSLTHNIEQLVDGRLNELTPKMVKDIIQEMIRTHLGWLVVWGGVFGGLIGLIQTFLP